MQIGQLFKIFQILGTPDPIRWPEVVHLPDWQVGFPQWPPQDLHQVHSLATAFSLPTTECRT